MLDKAKLLKSLKDRLEPAFHEEMLAYEQIIREIESGKFDVEQETK